MFAEINLQLLMALKHEENCLHMERQKATFGSAKRPERQRLMSATVCLTPRRGGGAGSVSEGEKVRTQRGES